MAGQAPQQQLSLDEMASQMAENMDLGLGTGRPIMKSGAHDLFKGGGGGGGLGDMPGTRGGTSGAEGGFTPQAGGAVIDQTAKGGAPSPAELVAKAGAYTGSDMNAEPGRQGKQPYTGPNTTMEPKGEVGGGSGEGGNLSTSDAVPRGRKAGKVGIDGGGDTGDGMPQHEDGKARGRKSGKVGISKSQLEMEIAKAQANLNALHQLAKGDVEVEISGDDDEDEDEAEKSMLIDGDELLKALDVLESVGAGVAMPTARDRTAALAKGLDEGSLTSEEMIELASLMKSQAESGETYIDVADADHSAYSYEHEVPMAKSFQEEWADDIDNQGDYNASPFLERFSQQTAAGLDQVQERLSKSLDVQMAERRVFNTQLAKSLKFMATRNLRQENLIKSLTDRLARVEQTPLPRAGVSGIGSLSKGMEGEVGAGQQLNYDRIGDTLVDMSMKMGNAPCGEDLQRAMASFEATGDISKSLYRDVAAFAQANQRR